VESSEHNPRSLHISYKYVKHCYTEATYYYQTDYYLHSALHTYAGGVAQQNVATNYDFVKSVSNSQKRVII